MKTSSLFSNAGPGKISISRTQPRGRVVLPEYQALAPGAWFNKVSKAEYERRYAAQLDALDLPKVVDDLQSLVGEAEPVLCCYERPPFNEHNWCHRRMFASYVEAKLGIFVPEWDRGY